MERGRNRRKGRPEVGVGAHAPVVVEAVEVGVVAEVVVAAVAVDGVVDAEPMR